MYCDKPQVNLLTFLLAAHGIHRVVVCPGSRNAVLVHDFNEHPDLQCFPATDERSAAFTAIGLIEADGRAAAVCVTSGSALLATLPAVAEAYYRRLPLVIISADRPAAWLDQMDGQTIRQENGLQPYAPTFTLAGMHDETGRIQAERTANTALLTALRGGPVHINVPLTEPLFSFTTAQLSPCRIMREVRPVCPAPLPADVLASLQAARLPVLIVGQYEGEIPEVLDQIEASDGILLLPELLANMPGAWRTAVLEQSNARSALSPDLVLHAGGNLVNKQLKLQLRASAQTRVIRIEEGDLWPDTFSHLDTIVRAPLADVLRQLASTLTPHAEVRRWKRRLEALRADLENAVTNTRNALTDGNVIRQACRISEFTPGVSLHLGNSMSVRHATRCLQGGKVRVHCNRGTNGIEGSLSAAAGHSLVYGGLTVAILGDLSFFYDQNALWNEKLDGRLRVLLLNNGGGDIFHRLPGLSASPALSEYISARHHATATGTAQAFGLRYIAVNEEAQLQPALRSLFQPGGERPLIVEVFT